PKMTTNLPRIDYYFDVISPYSYIGFETLQQLQHQWNGVEIRYIPFALANVMKESGTATRSAVRPLGHDDDRFEALRQILGHSTDAKPVFHEMDPIIPLHRRYENFIGARGT
uniref:DSBA domain-containing protein n=1 Tax=Caenorhabditis japonica TaxID=281687 RepID=A0A8R1ELZ0_CAEJA